MARKIEKEKQWKGQAPGWHPPMVAGLDPNKAPANQPWWYANLLGGGKTTLAPPPGTSTQTTNTPPGDTDGGSDGGGGPRGGGGGNISAAEASARKQGKDRTARENAATQGILDALFKSIAGYEAGRDTQLKNADDALARALDGILGNYNMAMGDYEESNAANASDYDAKTAANVANRARERMSLLQQAASQGAGETDQLRAQVQAFLNANANQLELDTARSDTERSILSQIANANSQAESQRRSAWNQNQEARGSAMNEFYKNYSDTMTNAQRVAAQNTNIDSDYSTGFQADTKGYNLVDEASRYAGQTYKEERKDDAWYKNFEGRRTGQRGRTASSSRAGATTISAPKAAEGATLRGRW
ncbi:hypothetical protein SEA_EUGENEKRABS_42 [Microbacterium phage EugeneKrabs]|nr:hypothetical protein SEA_EUGENEKRABS_42 [Microbacterium phage EugeneKrabs]